MLIQFQFKNYKSFLDETLFALSATEITEHPHHVIEVGNEKILKTAAIFGANASGKSNLYSALEYMQFYVRNSFGFGGDSASSNVTRDPTPFLFDATSKEEDSIFSIFFTLRDDDNIYNYGFCVNKEKVTEEWLKQSSTLIFNRNNESCELSGIPKDFRDNIKISLQKETLILSLGAKLKVDLLDKIYNWFGNFTFLNFGDPFENVSLSRIMPRDFVENVDVRRDVVDYLCSFDRGDHEIVAFEIEASGPNTYNIRTLHNASGMDKQVSIPLSREAAGTQKMFVLYSPVRDTLASGGVLFIDEFSDRLHPLLGRSIIQTFLDPERNPNNAQLIIITHDPCLFSSELFRRDEIWIAQKEKNGISRLYSLVDFKGEADPKIPKDKNYERDYLWGKYGGIPDLESIHFRGVK